MRLIATILLAVAVGLVAAAPADEIPRELGKADASHIPNPREEPERSELLCSACLSTGLELLKALRKVRKEFERQPDKLKEYHLLAAAGDVCEKATLNMGLARDEASRRVTTTFANEAAVRGKSAVVKGGWVTHMWKSECFDTIDRLEDDLRKIYNDDGKTYEFCPACSKIGKQGTLGSDEL